MTANPWKETLVEQKVRYTLEVEGKLIISRLRKSMHRLWSWKRCY